MDGNMENLDTDALSKQAAALIGNVISNFHKESGQLSDQGTRILFPSGIELISLEFKIGNSATITFRIAGKDAPLKLPAAAAIEEVALDVEGGWISSG
jgi:phosphotransferase system HPr-like phosphotransfer protein